MGDQSPILFIIKMGKTGTKHASTKHLSRILFVLNDSKKKMSRNDLKDATGITTNLKDALNFLSNHNLVKSIKTDNCVVKYFS